MIKAITFDLWNTIFQNVSYSKYRIAFLENFLQNRGEKYDSEKIKIAFEENFRNLDYNINDLDFKHRNIEERIRKLFDSLRIELTYSENEIVKQKMENTMLKNPPSLKKGVKETLKELSPKYKIGLISNTGITPGKVILKVFKTYQIYKYFQATVFSDEIGYYKPNALLFEIALNKLNCKPNEAIHIGDLLHTDIAGAKATGMKTIWLNDKNKSRSEEINPDFEIKELMEVIKIIKNEKG